MVFSFCMSTLFPACSSCDNRKQKASAATSVQACRWPARHGQRQECHTCETGGRRAICVHSSKTNALYWLAGQHLDPEPLAIRGLSRFVSQNAHNPRGTLPCATAANTQPEGASCGWSFKAEREGAIAHPNCELVLTHCAARNTAFAAHAPSPCALAPERAVGQPVQQLRRRGQHLRGHRDGDRGRRLRACRRCRASRRRRLRSLLRCCRWRHGSRVCRCRRRHRRHVGFCRRRHGRHVGFCRRRSYGRRGGRLCRERGRLGGGLRSYRGRCRLRGCGGGCGRAQRRGLRNDAVWRVAAVQQRLHGCQRGCRLQRSLWLRVSWATEPKNPA